SAAKVRSQWTFEDSTITRDDSSITWAFKTPGQHIFHVTVLRTGDNAPLCSAVDTFNSANYKLTISPDSLQGNVLMRYTFKANLNPFKPLGHNALLWTIDSNSISRYNTDTISWVFSQMGVHRIQVVRLDTSSGSKLEMGTTVVSISGLPVSIT